MRSRTSLRPVSADELGRGGAEHGGGRQWCGAALASHGRGHRFETCHAHQHEQSSRPGSQRCLPEDLPENHPSKHGSALSAARIEGLVLQPRFLSLAVLPVTVTSTRLMTPAPPRPAKHPFRLGRQRPDQQAQQPADLWDAEGHQRLGQFCALSRPPCRPPRRGRAGRPGTPGPASTR
jgi:hypothetical protein